MTNVFWIRLSRQFDTKDFKMGLEVMAPESAAAVVVQGLSFQGQRFQFLLFQNQIVFLSTFENVCLKECGVCHSAADETDD